MFLTHSANNIWLKLLLLCSSTDNIVRCSAIIKPLLKTDNSNRIRDNSIADTLAAFEAKIWT